MTDNVKKELEIKFELMSKCNVIYDFHGIKYKPNWMKNNENVGKIT